MRPHMNIWEIYIEKSAFTKNPSHGYPNDLLQGAAVFSRPTALNKKGIPLCDPAAFRYLL